MIDTERINSKLSAIEQKKKVNGSRKEKRLKAYSPEYIELFSFFLKSFRADILTFSGSAVTVKKGTKDARFAFREYETGVFKNRIPESKHTNILFAIIVAKKSWGLHMDQWSDGICERSFTKKEILEQFDTHNIKIPKKLLDNFEKIILKKRIYTLENEKNRLEQY